ncbi:zinc finger CCCH domain-containing protein 48 isoform X2 [Ziziphus jujuba]|uniref:Zinc finger CCCH domain-containing protein 48 isoform X2 n=1 Tax=Ziziphus jujuba TaxID=326968 RepID=A0ABM3IET3_ZIZJJ|nr:zinc finger CCCH domain-containing protein 48 isoform X2 [Ziziphus jujuba]
MDVDGGGNKRVFQRLGGSSTDPKNKVCYHWRAGKCNRYPCPFLHRELPSPPIQPPNGTASSKRHHVFNAAAAGDPTVPRRAPNNTWGRPHAGRGGGGANNRVVRKMDKVCSYWLQGNCSRGETCKFLHSWSLGDGFSLLSQLDGHQKVVSAIAMPAGSDKLYTGSKDETLRVWDCQSGQCIGVLNLGGEVGCMISEGPWIFVGLPSIVKAWNTQTNMDLSLSGPVGQVYALIVGNDLLFAGTQVWNLETLQCIQTLTEHTNVVMSVLIWDHYLLSCSLDKTIKAWVTGQSGNLEVAYTHTEEHGLLTLGGMYDSESKPLLLCSTNDNSVRIYDLPSFAERGKIFSKMEIRAIQIGPGGIFFTGDGTGQVKVWKLAAVEAANPA